MTTQQLKFIKRVRDKGGFTHPVLVYSKDHAKAGNRTFKSISAAARHIGTLDVRMARRG